MSSQTHTTVDISQHSITADEASPEQIAIALKTVLNILDKWKCKPAQKQAILAMGRSTLYKYQEEPASAKLTCDQIERMSFILNIHQALRITFSNPENVYGFMSMKNHNPFFAGKSPLDLVCSGSFATLYEVYKRIDAMRGSTW